jgi:hypothetical protein
MQRGGLVRGLLVAILLIVAIGGAAYYAYCAGMAQGLMDSGKLVAPATGAAPIAPLRYYGRFIHPFGFGFGALGCVFPVLFLFLFMGLLRGVFFHRHWGMHHPDWENRVPPRFEEWHRRAHESTPADNK